MRFIVDLYRYIILAVLALLIAGFAFFVLSLGGNSGYDDASLATIIIAGLAFAGILGVSLGLVATFISIHDRHIELVNEVKLMRQALEQRGDR